MQWQLSASVIAEAGTALCLLIVVIFFPWRDLNRRANLIGSMLLTIAALWILTHSLEIGTPIASYKAYLMGLQLVWGLIASQPMCCKHARFELLHTVHFSKPNICVKYQRMP